MLVNPQFINTFAGKACAKTGNKPGVTKGKQWIRLNKNVELLDTPGILWPKFEDQLVGIRLACVGSIKDDILNIEELALWLLEKLKKDYPGALRNVMGFLRRELHLRHLSDRQSEGLPETWRRTGLCEDFRADLRRFPRRQDRTHYPGMGRTAGE